MLSINIDPEMSRGFGPRDGVVFEIRFKRETVPVETRITIEQGYPGATADPIAETAAEYNAWLASLPTENWSDGIELSEFREVEWVHGEGLVEKRA